MNPITQEQFLSQTAHLNEMRESLRGLTEERAWFSHAALLGCVLFDLVDHDWSWVALGKDQNGLYRGFDRGINFAEESGATRALKKCLHRFEKTTEFVMKPFAEVQREAKELLTRDHRFDVDSMPPNVRAEFEAARTPKTRISDQIFERAKRDGALLISAVSFEIPDVGWFAALLFDDEKPHAAQILLQDLERAIGPYKDMEEAQQAGTRWLNELLGKLRAAGVTASRPAKA